MPSEHVGLSPVPARFVDRKMKHLAQIGTTDVRSRHTKQPALAYAIVGFLGSVFLGLGG
jgi:hypothetical protein